MSILVEYIRPDNEIELLKEFESARVKHECNNILTNNDASESYVEYYFNSIASIENVIEAIDNFVQHE
jgi:hypothetical protein